MILHIPHSSTHVPEGYSLDANQEDFNMLTDWYTNELFYHPFSEKLVFKHSRLFCDVERYRDNSKEEKYKEGQGVVYTKGINNRTIRDTRDDDEEEIKINYYDKWHREFNIAINRELTLFPTVVIVDCHSFNEMMTTSAPDFCIGINDSNVPPVIDELMNKIKEKGFTVELNTPYAGSMIPEWYIGNEEVKTVMIEVNRKLYLDKYYNKSESFYYIKEFITELLSILSEYENKTETTN